jgi:hypothetical protein
MARPWCLLLFVAATSLDARSAPISLEAPIDCAQWLEARKHNVSVSLESYVLGELNALSYARGKEFWRSRDPPISRESVYYWIDQHCRNHPMDDVFDAVLELFDERARPPKQRGDK